MSRRYGRVRCSSCGTWVDLDAQHTCPSLAAVMAAAFGGPGRVAGSNDVPCWDARCECKALDRIEVAA